MIRCTLVTLLILAGACRAPEPDTLAQPALLAAQQTAPPAVSAPSADSLASVTLPPELDRVLRDYERGWRARDADALAALFAPDGFILRPGHAPVRGRAAIAEAYRGAGGPLHLHAFAYEASDSVAYLIGGYRTAPASPDAGKYVLALRRAPDGQWYIMADMDNGNGARE